MAMSDGESLSVGTVVKKRYEILRVVGQGGLGTVYQVRDNVYGRENVYALKELIDQSASARKQFTQETKWLEGLDHPHIPKVRDDFEWEKRLYLLMDFVDGENLDQKLRRLGGRGMPERQIIEWILPICDALQYLHSRTPPILHRDVKPANIIVTPQGHPVLVDLGIAKEHLPGANQTATFVRKAGTEGYAPPEQYTSAGQAGPWSDVYSLGATLYELLTGCIPPTAVERVALDQRLLPLRELNPAISPHVAAAVFKALAIRPAERFQYMADFTASLLAPDTTSPGMMAMPHAPSSAPSMSGPARPISGPMGVPPMAAPMSPRMGGSAPSAPGASSPLTPLSLPPEMWAPTPTPPRQYPSAPSLSGGIGNMPLARGMQSASDLAHLPAPMATATVETSSARRWYALPAVWVVAAVALLVIAGVVGFTVLGLFTPIDRSTPHATVSGYFTALQAQDDTRAWQFTAGSRNNPAAQATFISGLQADDGRFGKVLSFQISQVNGDSSGHAQVMVMVARAQASSGPMTYTLSLTQYDGSTWLIDSVSGS